jgi:hypothetical protein
VKSLDHLVLLRLTVYNDAYRITSDVAPHLPVEWTVPSIQFLHLRGIKLNEEFMRSNIHQLVWDPSSVNTALHKFPHLTSLAFASWSIELSQPGPVELPTVRALDITNSGISSTHEALSRLVLKSLTSLAAHLCQSSEIVSLSQIITSFQCSDLSKLVLRFDSELVTKGRGELSKLFASCCSLETVCMSVRTFTGYNEKVSDAMLKAFAIWKISDRQQHSHLPKLKHLEVHMETGLGLKSIRAPSELLDMMESRTNTSTDTHTVSAAMSPTEDARLFPLECVTWRASVMLSFNNTDQERLNRLRKRGVRYESFRMTKSGYRRLENFYI